MAELLADVLASPLGLPSEPPLLSLVTLFVASLPGITVSAITLVSATLCSPLAADRPSRQDKTGGTGCTTRVRVNITVYREEGQSCPRPRIP